MNSTSAFISLGLVLGSWAAGVTGWFFWFTRPHRKVRNPIVFGLVYIVIVVSALGSLALLLGATERMGVGRTSQGYTARYAWIAGFACVAILVMKSEITWRRSAGLGDKKVLPLRDKGN